MQGTAHHLPLDFLSEPPAPLSQLWLRGTRRGGRATPWEQTTGRSGEDRNVGDGQEGEGLATASGEVSGKR